MRNIVVPPVGDGGTEVRQVHGRSQDFSLADGKRNHGGGVPAPAPVGPVVGFGRGDAAGKLGRKIAAQLAPEAETLHIFVPGVQTLCHIVVFAVVQDILEHVAIIGVAGHHDALLHVEGAFVHMAAQFVAGAEMIAL